MLILSRSRQQGFTLIEVLVTVVVVSIGLLGLAGLQINGLRANLSSEARSKATLLASDIIERMRANPLGIAGNNYDGIDSSAFDCDADPDPFCSNTSNTVADNCDSAEMATFDAWIWACGLPPANANVLRGGVSNLLNQGIGKVTCEDVPCLAGSTYRIDISWNELNPNSADAATSGVDTVQTLSLSVVP